LLKNIIPLGNEGSLIRIAFAGIKKKENKERGACRVSFT
jgi:hypothetical protein